VQYDGNWVMLDSLVEKYRMTQ